MTRASKDKHTPNDTFASYRLVTRIAMSQSCEVWEVRHGRSRRGHAMKIMAPSLRGQRDQIAYLKHEFAVGQPLHHETIIRTEEFGVDDGLAYLVMEYFPAPNMKQWIRDHSPEADGLIPSIILNAASALGYFHKEGWIHRDVKPENFLIGETGEVKLIDFALAKRERSWLGRLLDSSSKAQGTMSYMSPEQIRNKPQDQRADLYSYGCVVYELVCGKPPYTGTSPRDLLNKHIKSSIPGMNAKDRRLNAVFADIVTSLLAKDPTDRPDSMDQVLTQLQSINIFLD